MSDDAPPLVSSSVALLSATVALVLTAVSTYTLAAGALGAVVALVGFTRGSRGTHALGTALLAGSIVLAGMLGVAPRFLLAAACFALVSWDVGRNGFSIVAEVGSEAPTLRIELLHAVSSTVVFALGSSVGYAVFLTATGTQSVLALLALLVGSVALSIALQGE
nr:hypothetical protein [Haloferax mucosum]